MIDAVGMFPHLFAGMQPAAAAPAAIPAMAPDAWQPQANAGMQAQLGALVAALDTLTREIDQLAAKVNAAPGALPAAIALPAANPLAPVSPSIPALQPAPAATPGIASAPVAPAPVAPLPAPPPPPPPPPPAPPVPAAVAPPPPPPPAPPAPLPASPAPASQPAVPSPGPTAPVAANAPAPLRTVAVHTSAELATALAGAQPGDRIELATGSYTFPSHRVSLHGTADHPITIASAPGATATIESGNNLYGFQLDHSEYVTITGLRFAPRGPNTMRALNITDCNHIQLLNNWIGPGGEGQQDASPVHFGADGSGKTNNHNLVAGNTIYATAGHLASHCIYFGSGGGTDVQILNNDLHFAGPASVFPCMIQFNPENHGTYSGVVIQGNTLTSDTGGGGGFALNAVANVDISHNTIRLKRDASGKGGAILETWTDGNAGGRIAGLQFHDNDASYDQPGRGGRASFVFSAHTQASFSGNRLGNVTTLKEGAYAAGVAPQ